MNYCLTPPTTATVPVDSRRNTPQVSPGRKRWLICFCSFPSDSVLMKRPAIGSRLYCKQPVTSEETMLSSTMYTIFLPQATRMSTVSASRCQTLVTRSPRAFKQPRHANTTHPFPCTHSSPILTLETSLTHEWLIENTGDLPVSRKLARNSPIICHC